MQKHKILVVEDEKPLKKMLETMLEISGFNVIGIDNGLDALKVLRNDEISLVLLDINMAGLSGIDILRIIRSDPQLKDIKVIMLSAESYLEENKISCKDLGVSEIFQKPADMKDIIAKIKETLEIN